MSPVVELITVVLIDVFSCVTSGIGTKGGNEDQRFIQSSEPISLTNHFCSVVFTSGTFILTTALIPTLKTAEDPRVVGGRHVSPDVVFVCMNTVTLKGHRVSPGHRVIRRHAHTEAERGRPPVWEGNLWRHDGLRPEQSKEERRTWWRQRNHRAVFVSHLLCCQRQQVILTERWASQHKEIHFSSMHPGWADTPGKSTKPTRAYLSPQPGSVRFFHLVGPLSNGQAAMRSRCTTFIGNERWLSDSGGDGGNMHPPLFTKNNFYPPLFFLKKNEDIRLQCR